MINYNDVSIGYESATKGYLEVFTSTTEENYSDLMHELYMPLQKLRQLGVLKTIVCVRAYYDNKILAQYGSI
jgi:hypothetical protein